MLIGDMGGGGSFLYYFFKGDSCRRHFDRHLFSRRSSCSVAWQTSGTLTSIRVLQRGLISSEDSIVTNSHKTTELASFFRSSEEPEPSCSRLDNQLRVPQRSLARRLNNQRLLSYSHYKPIQPVWLSWTGGYIFPLRNNKPIHL